MFPVELIPELRERIVSFLGAWGIIPLTLTCRQALEDIEAYSRRELDRIEREHNVDDTWRFRVGMQAAQDAVARLALEGRRRLEGVMLVPNNVSHRRMLRSAYRTHLYSLGTTPSREWAGYLALAMHPDGKHLLSGGHGGAGDSSTVRLWDLSTKQCVQSFIGHESSVDNLGFSGGHVVSSSGDEPVAFRVWSMDGTCKHVVDVSERADGPTRFNVMAPDVSNEMVYFVGLNGPIYSFNTISGTGASMEQPWGEATAYPVDLRICRNYLLHLRCSDDDAFDDETSENDDVQGIYVFEMESMRVQSHLVGEFSSMASASDGDVAVAMNEDEIRVFQVQGGNLVPRFFIASHPPPRHLRDMSTTVLYMTRSEIFVMDEWRVRRQSRITIYNAHDGTLVRRVYYPIVQPVVARRPNHPIREVAETVYFPVAMTSNDKEFFVGFNLGDESHRTGCAIKAFLR